MKKYEIKKVGLLNCVLVKVYRESRTDYPSPDFCGTKKALAGIVEDGATIEDWYKKKKACHARALKRLRELEESMKVKSKK